MTEPEARAWIRVFERTYPTFVRWQRAHADRCAERRLIVIGRDAAEGVGRFYPRSWMAEGKSFYTRSCNLPIQGACADAAMLALAAIDRMLFEEGIEGGPVAWVHDEILLEVAKADAERASVLLVKAMTDAFAETFPGAPLNGSGRGADRHELGGRQGEAGSFRSPNAMSKRYRNKFERNAREFYGKAPPYSRPSLN